MTESVRNNDDQWLPAIINAWQLVKKEGIAATIEGAAALRLHGCAISPGPWIEISVQWDAIETFFKNGSLNQKSILNKFKRICFFTFKLDDYYVKIIGYLGTVVRTDPDRMSISIGTEQIAVKSLSSFLRCTDPDDTCRKAAKSYMQKLQAQDADRNGQAWNDEAYRAWINRFGTPEEAAAKIKRDPIGRLGSLADYLTDCNDQCVINLLGSHAGKALALSLLGANVTVVDISAENAAYAGKTAEALGVSLNYIVSDVLKLPIAEHKGRYDKVFMELGILHYFIDLEPLADLIEQLLKPGGTFIIQEFHPVSTKLVTTRGKRQIVFGNYFDQSLHTRSVAFTKHLDPSHQCKAHEERTVYLREWTLGEIVTTFAQAGLIVSRLDEQPNMKINDIGLPKLFTLVCVKPGGTKQIQRKC
ncbi:class I SAM-dependent methyltransferase [Sporolactobacillus terrae]|uniref:Class I SAM-dependent methyltransferase n=1 Tax=Sporolactobacillus terrae TaxID=269673 RepID=A0ABX5Q7A6_9BACL|nr:class I SAM-dependent methyltransferase [Sporolactobacillus terrae]QAA22528.1 class I SAM-dependent methyltransferase [Sporolactobacillus terrae]QAA25502.1 class I SAM-dependent methyltransferase [Sporolactobacillus terrae]UAK17313.1 class I SAM-dependent methyltransferase [Sporolactobacillus terrae]